mgnify:CR=1 FL=1
MTDAVSLGSILKDIRLQSRHVVTIHFVNGYLFVIERRENNLPTVHCYVSDDGYMYLKKAIISDFPSSEMHDIVSILDDFWCDDAAIKEMLEVSAVDLQMLRSNTQPTT